MSNRTLIALVVAGFFLIPQIHAQSDFERATGIKPPFEVPVPTLPQVIEKPGDALGLAAVSAVITPIQATVFLADSAAKLNNQALSFVTRATGPAGTVITGPLVTANQFTQVAVGMLKPKPHDGPAPAPGVPPSPSKTKEIEKVKNLSYDKDAVLKLWRDSVSKKAIEAYKAKYPKAKLTDQQIADMVETDGQDYVASKTPEQLDAELRNFWEQCKQQKIDEINNRDMPPAPSPAP